jgi:hypothetical protein
MISNNIIYFFRIEGYTDKVIQYLCYDVEKLGKLCALISENLKNLKKSIGLLAQPLRTAIWNWITNFPQEFIVFSQELKTITGNPLDIVDSLLTWSGATKQRQEIAWPTITILLLLTPDSFSDIVMDIKKSVKNEKWKKEQKFLTTLIKSLKQKTLVEVSVVCFVDLFKASTYLNKNELRALRFLIGIVQTDLQGIIFFYFSKKD